MRYSFNDSGRLLCGLLWNALRLQCDHPEFGPPFHLDIEVKQGALVALLPDYSHLLKGWLGHLFHVYTTWWYDDRRLMLRLTMYPGYDRKALVQTLEKEALWEEGTKEQL